MGTDAPKCQQCGTAHWSSQPCPAYCKGGPLYDPPAPRRAAKVAKAAPAPDDGFSAAEAHELMDDLEAQEARIKELEAEVAALKRLLASRKVTESPVTETPLRVTEKTVTEIHEPHPSRKLGRPAKPAALSQAERAKRARLKRKGSTTGGST